MKLQLHWNLLPLNILLKLAHTTFATIYKTLKQDVFHMLSMPPPILQEVHTPKSTRANVFIAVFMAFMGFLTLVLNVLPGTGDFYNTIGLMGAFLPMFTAWLVVGFPQPISLFLPGRMFDKYLSSCVILILAAFASFVFPAVLTLFGELPLEHILGAYLGLVLLGVSYLSLGVCLRLMISSAPALGVVSFATSACMFFTILEPRFAGFVKGLPSLGGVLFFVSFSIFFVIIAALALQEPRRSVVMPKAILTALALVVLNIFAARLPMYADLTRERIFTLSEATLTVLDGLEAPVDIYAVFPPGHGDRYLSITKEILLAYGRHPNVNVSFAPSRRLSELGYLAPGSVVAIGGGGGSVHGHESAKIIPPEKIFLTGFDEDELQIYVSGINIEAELTHAILYCTSCENPVFAQALGNNEMLLPQGFIDALISANYNVSQIMVTDDDILNEVSVLLVTTPAADWGEAEAAKLARYLDGGGSAVFALDAGSREPWRLSAILDGIGIELGERIVVETQDYMHMGSNVIAATRPFGEGGRVRRVLVPNARAVYLSAMADGNVYAQDIITTSPFAREQPRPWEAEDEYLGIFALAARVEAERANPTTSRVVVLGSSKIFDMTANELSGGENYRFLIDAINWAQGVEHPLDIEPIAINTTSLAIDIFWAVIVMGALGVILPGLIVSLGLLLRR